MKKQTVVKSSPELYRYTLSDGAQVIKSVTAENLNEAEEKFGLKAEYCFQGMAVLKSQRGDLFGVKWEAASKADEHAALVAVSEDAKSVLKVLENHGRDGLALSYQNVQALRVVLEKSLSALHHVRAA